MMSELTQIFIDLSGLKVGWGETCLKGWGLKAMMSELIHRCWTHFSWVGDPVSEMVKMGLLYEHVLESGCFRWFILKSSYQLS